jgi:type I restriction enzyme, S subunit
MSMKWPTVKLGATLRHRKEFITIDDLTSYKRPRVQLHVQGIVLRDEVPGALIKTKKQQVCRTGEFLVAEIDAKVGGFGIVPDSLNTSIVSSHYFLFVVDESKLNRRFLDFFIRTPAFREQVAAQGSTNYAAIRPAHVLGYKVPLPPLAEQRRVVRQIEELAVQIGDAQTLRRKADAEAEALIPRVTTSLLDDAGWTTSPLGKILAEKPRNGLCPQQEVESGGRAMLRINAVSSSPTRYVDMTGSKQVEVVEDVAEQFVIRNDDVFIVRYNGDIKRVAKPAIYKGSNESRAVYPDKLIRLRPNVLKMTPDFLVFALTSRTVRMQIEGLGKTTAGNIGVSGSNAQSFIVPVPPLPEQRRIVSELDALQAEVDALKRLQAEMAAELEAMLPAILDRAFKGEL